MKTIHSGTVITRLTSRPTAMGSALLVAAGLGLTLVACGGEGEETATSTPTATQAPATDTPGPGTPTPGVPSLQDPLSMPGIPTLDPADFKTSDT